MKCRSAPYLPVARRKKTAAADFFFFITAAADFSKEEKEIDARFIKHNKYSNNFYWNKVIAEHLLYILLSLLLFFPS